MFHVEPLHLLSKKRGLGFRVDMGCHLDPLSWGPNQTAEALGEESTRMQCCSWLCSSLVHARRQPMMLRIQSRLKKGTIIYYSLLQYINT